MSATNYTIRDARQGDVAAINALYNQAVDEDLLDWNSARPLAVHQAFFDKMKSHRYPLLVAENGDSQVIAYGALDPQSVAEGSSFMFNTNLVLVVDSKHRRHGIAKSLWTELCSHQLTFDRSIYVVLHIVLSTNAAALALASALNFHHDGVLSEVAVKKSEFVDLVFYSCFVGSSPALQGLGFPEDPEWMPSPSSSFSNINLDGPNFRIRDATMKDLPFLTSVYNDGITTTNALEFFIEKTPEERGEWLQRLIDEQYPILIAEEDGAPLGYVSLTPWNEAPDQCFPHAAHISAHVRADVKRKKVGETLFRSLITHRFVKERHIYQIVADVTTANGAAMHGCVKAKFKQGVVQNRVMIKFGEAFSMAWMQLRVGQQKSVPATTGPRPSI